MGRPSGWLGQKASVRSSMTRSSGVSSTMLISSKMTFFSLVISSGSNRGVGEGCGAPLQVEGGVLLACEGVHVAADGVDLGRDDLRRAVLGALEHHVLDEVADSGLGPGLLAAC